ncbi:hypothetical protein Tco_1378246 [Tanacetum coccineum]
MWSLLNSSPSTTHVIEKIDKIEKLIIDGKVTLVDDEGKPLEKVDYSGDYDSEDEVASVDNEMASFLAKKDGYGTQSLLEQWKESYENGDYEYDPYDDDMYEGQDIPDKLQAICDNLDIKVKGHLDGEPLEDDVCETVNSLSTSLSVDKVSVLEDLVGVTSGVSLISRLPFPFL